MEPFEPVDFFCRWTRLTRKQKLQKLRSAVVRSVFYTPGIMNGDGERVNIVIGSMRDDDGNEIGTCVVFGE